MDAFIQRHEQDVIGVLSGFDRMRFRGTVRSISYAKGVDQFLGAMGVRYKDFKTYVLGLSQALLDHSNPTPSAGLPDVGKYWRCGEYLGTMTRHNRQGRRSWCRKDNA